MSEGKAGNHVLKAGAGLKQDAKTTSGLIEKFAVSPLPLFVYQRRRGRRNTGEDVYLLIGVGGVVKGRVVWLNE